MELIMCYIIRWKYSLPWSGVFFVIYSLFLLLFVRSRSRLCFASHKCMLQMAWNIRGLRWLSHPIGFAFHVLNLHCQPKPSLSSSAWSLMHSNENKWQTNENLLFHLQFNVYLVIIKMEASWFIHPIFIQGKTLTKTRMLINFSLKVDCNSLFDKWFAHSFEVKILQWHNYHIQTPMFNGLLNNQHTFIKKIVIDKWLTEVLSPALV